MGMPANVVTRTEELYDGSWKYVVTSAGDVRFVPNDGACGAQHIDLVQPGERAARAGVIHVYNSLWLMIRASSPTLCLDGDKADDAAFLATIMGKQAAGISDA